MKRRTCHLAVVFLSLVLATPGQSQDGSPASGVGKVTVVENIVQSVKAGISDDEENWANATVDQVLGSGDQLRTGRRSRAMLRLTDLYNVRVEQLTTLRLTPAVSTHVKARLELSEGKTLIFSREKFGEIDIGTPTADGALRGTQLYAEMSRGGRAFFQVIEGHVTMSNAQGKLELGPGDAGEAFPGQKPRRTARIDAVNLLQWALYYPAVLDPDELGLPAAERGGARAASLAAYRSGDLLGALEKLGNAGAPASRSGRLWHANVLLAVGRLDEASAILAGIPAGEPGRRALERMIAAVKNQEREAWPDESLATAGEAIAESYYRQSRGNLEAALSAARLAVRLAPRNGYAWTRIAELEFSFGRSREAREALTNALAFTPDNAQAHALQGFVLAAENEIGKARASFDTAIALDGALGNGWLGRGLMRIKRGELEEGRADLQSAATAEPTVSIFHSYLGKAFGMEHRGEDARMDLTFALKLDPRDPTPYLYSALEYQALNRINQAIADLECSIGLNDNRRVYRSGFLLDQDRAVRSANLAKIYQKAGMVDVAVREATRAVESDYTNPSAHLFLANAFDALRDPKRIELRHETPWFNELLISNLLAPVGGGPLSQFVSQQEYSKLLEEDGLGGSLTTEVRSNSALRHGSEIRSAASLFGNSGDFSFGIDAYYRDDPGTRVNSEGELQELYAQLKWQPTPDDVFYFLGKWADQQSGDNFETYDDRPLSPYMDFQEGQTPGLLLAGWNHRWAPGSHTLVLAGRLAAEQVLIDPRSTQLLVSRFRNAPGFPNPLPAAPDGSPYPDSLYQEIGPWLGSGTLDVVRESGPFDFATRRDFELYTAEVQHILQGERNLLLGGVRWQTGSFETDARLRFDGNTDNVGRFDLPAADQHSEVDFSRTTVYAYDYFDLTPCFTLIGGLSWDHLEHPVNFRNPPLSNAQTEDDQLSGKLGFTYAPSRSFTMRGLYSQGMGGVTYDESVRLEPVQVAGFNQAFRTAISESLAGSVEAPEYEIFGLALEGSLSSRTWWGVSFHRIEEKVDRMLGSFTGYTLGEVSDDNPVFFADQTLQLLDYCEHSVDLTVNQLLGDEFAVGGRYRFTHSELGTRFPTLAGSRLFALEDSATLHEISLYADWNSPTGLFARAEANYFIQDIQDDPLHRYAPRNGDDFSQVNLMAGYRFNRNLCEISAGVLNLFGSNYHITPLTPHPELSRDRTAFVRLRVSF